MNFSNDSFALWSVLQENDGGHRNNSIDMPGEPEIISLDKDKVDNNRKLVCVVVIIFYLIGMLINLRVLCAVNQVSKQKMRRPVTRLVAHLSLVSIIFTILSLVLVAENTTSTSFNSLPGYCQVMGFLRNAIYNVFAINTVAIVFERMRKFEPKKFGGVRLLTNRLIFLIWITAFVANVPAGFMNDFVEDMSGSRGRGKCRSIRLLGNFGATVFYELLRFIIFHVLVVFYLFNALLKIYLKVKTFSVLKNPQLPTCQHIRAKMKSIRFIYLHFVIFILFWLPAGLVTFLHRVLNRRPSGPRSPLVLIAFGILIYVYLCLSPLINLYLIQNNDFSCFCLGKCEDVPKSLQSKSKNLEQNGISTNGNLSVTATIAMNECENEIEAYEHV